MMNIFYTFLKLCYHLILCFGKLIMTKNSLNAADAKVFADNPEAELIDLILPDSNGLLRGKRITRDALEKVFEAGVCLPMSLMATDVTGNTVEESGLGYDIGDEDRICRW